MRALAAVLAAALLAGCLSGSQPQGLAPADAVGDLAARVREALGGDLPCEAEVGEGTSANVGHLASSALDRNGFTGAGEVWLTTDDRALVARYGTGGFSVVDLSDPLAPVELGAWDPEATQRGLDVKATTDGTAALVGNDDGIRIVDIRDPRALVEEHHEALATQAHMLTVFRVGDADYVAATKGDRRDMPIWRIVGEPGAHRLERVAEPVLTTLPRLTGQEGPHDLLRTHDAFFLDDPLAGPTLWVANVWDGIVALDVADPSRPREVARIPNTLVQYTHTVQTAVADIDGEPRRVTVSVSEVGANTMRVFDTTDLAAPRLLAEWHVPNLLQPQHNPQLVWPWLFMAHYTEGVLVFDLAALVAGEDKPQPVARLASQGEDRGSSTPTTSVFGAAGFFGGTWDVVVKDGLLFASDAGLQVAAFGCVTPGDAAVRSLG